MEERNDLRNDHYDDQYKRMDWIENAYRDDPIFGGKEKKRLIQTLLFVVAIISLIIGLRQLADFGSAGKDAINDLTDTIVGEEGHVTTITEAELTNILKEQKLYTAEHPYNGYVAVPDGKDGVKYYVAYEGVISAGFDTSKIELTLDNETHTITIRLPEVEIGSPIVDEKSLDYIFKDPKAETETVGQEAYKFAYTDLTQKSYKDAQLKAAAVASAKNVTQQLLEPWLNSGTGEKYTITVLAHNEKNADESISADNTEGATAHE